MDPWISGMFALGGVIVGGGVQFILTEQKYLADAIDRVRERQVLFATCVSQYLQYVRNIQHSESKNRLRGEPVPLSPEQRADLSTRYRSVVASTYALMACGSADLARDAKNFLKEFEAYVDKHPDITTGDQRRYEPQGKVKGLAGDVQELKNCAVEVTLTIEDAAGELGSVTASGSDYAVAYEAARALIPEGCRALSIRTSD